MATVWDLIREHSTAPEGSTFWEHLNSQEGGGGGTGIYHVHADGLECTIDDSKKIALIGDLSFEVEVSMEKYEVEIEF